MNTVTMIKNLSQLTCDTAAGQNLFVRRTARHLSADVEAIRAEADGLIQRLENLIAQLDADGMDANLDPNGIVDRSGQALDQKIAAFVAKRSMMRTILNEVE
jgi:hypothetical protein